ncbi:MAG TPA: hypothetical protein VKB88_44130 [Bryobacteraceae bacterium]|nr:hypothetical protein [Bryobacteraceae bacterium]
MREGNDLPSFGKARAGGWVDPGLRRGDDRERQRDFFTGSEEEIAFKPDCDGGACAPPFTTLIGAPSICHRIAWIWPYTCRSQYETGPVQVGGERSFAATHPGDGIAPESGRLFKAGNRPVSTHTGL